MILIPQEAPTYAPTVTLTGTQLENAIHYAQSLVESPLGANRPLEPTEYVEQKRVNYKLQSFHLSHFPIINPPEPVIRIRTGNVQNTYRRAIPPLSDWRTINSQSYAIDSNRQVLLNVIGSSGYIEPAQYSNYRLIATEAEVTYTAGIDFTQNTHEVKTLKSAFGALLTYLQSSIFAGVTSLEMPKDEFKVGFGSASQAGFIPDNLLIPFRKYRII